MKVIIFKSYFFYSRGYFKNSIFCIDNFISMFPYNNNILYLCYLKCMCYYSYLKNYRINNIFISYSKFLMILFIKYFSSSIYFYKIQKRIFILNNLLLYYDKNIYQSYIFYNKYISSVNKLKKIVNLYEINLYTSILFYKIVKIYYSLNRKYIAFKYFYFFDNNFKKSLFHNKLYYLFHF